MAIDFWFILPLWWFRATAAAAAAALVSSAFVHYSGGQKASYKHTDTYRFRKDEEKCEFKECSITILFRSRMLHTTHTHRMKSIATKNAIALIWLYCSTFLACILGTPSHNNLFRWIFSMKSNTINHIWCHQCIDEMLDFLPQNFLFGTFFCVTKYLNTKHILGLDCNFETTMEHIRGDENRFMMINRLA